MVGKVKTFLVEAMAKIFLDLPGGLRMPAIGLGTCENKDEKELEVALDTALELGYRHIDTAWIYSNEDVIGRVLKKWFSSGKMQRDDLFITTKLSFAGVHPTRVEKFLKKSLEKLQMDYVDSYLIHFPVGSKMDEETLNPVFDENGEIAVEGPTDHEAIWKKMEEQVKAGRTKTIGLSNYSIPQIERILKVADIKPASLQVELHVFLQQRALVDFCRNNGIAVVAYSPLANPAFNKVLKKLNKPEKELPDILGNPVVAKIAKKHSKTPAQVALRFLLQRGVAAIPKSSKPKRIKENFDVFDFVLDEDDMKELFDLEIGEKARVCDFKFFERDLTSNNITGLNETSLSRYAHLEELSLSENKLDYIHPKAFSKNFQLKRLFLQGCGLIDIPAEAIAPLVKLQTLHLGNNDIWRVDDGGTTQLVPPSLRSLRLDGNRLRVVPTDALWGLPHLEVLNIGNNLITSISEAAFPELDKLVVLLLKRNQITEIAEDAFANVTSLRVLELDNNFLTQIPTALIKLPNLQELSISSNRIKYIPGGLLQKTPALALLELRGNPLIGVDAHAFSYLPRLRKLILSEARDLSMFPNLNGTTALEILRLDRAGITSVPPSLCNTCPKLKSLDLKSNKLKAVPDLNSCRDMRVLDLASNQIRSIENRPFQGMYQMHDLLLAHNEIQYIPQDAFFNLSRLQVLDLEDNAISFIHPDAFLPISNIEDLNLGRNVFSHLPSAGLERLLHLKTFNNPNLREFPPPENFKRIQTLVLAYAYHCCAFLPLIPSNPPPEKKPTEFIVIPDMDDKNIDKSMWNSSSNDFWPSQQNITSKFGSKFQEFLNSIGDDYSYPGNFPAYVEEYAEEETTRIVGNQVDAGKIRCLPSPGPFLPCQDLFDWWTLRCGVWIVFLCAMLGNGTVVFVIIFSRGKMDVPRFLVCNLAAADFFMGIYLGFLAVVDASTLGEFRMYAIPWQMSAGCQLSGFLGVLSSELSVYTLAVITLERNYAITHAMHLNKRLSLKHAGYIMICGWSFAIVMALLPLFSVSDYRKFAVCLPFETKDAASLTYVVFLMLINGIAFLILMGCYLKMYCAIRGSQAWNSNDSRIAKRMALLVFTDFLCWSPIAFFALTAAFGLQLITLEQAKVFTVFVLPLNSCCNPFLYAILTKQFKKDCVMICKAIEESRVTRGIGRCRHSSNFSNRQTPANTNSLADRSSREKENHHVPTCTCNVKLLGDRSAPPPKTEHKETTREWLWSKARWLLCVQKPPRHRPRSDQYTYQIAEIQQKQHKRASSVSSSENFSSSRSDSWRHNHHCGIPLRLLETKRRASSWLVTRKTSQDSNLSSSRNDSSGSATTASTSTWRISRSSGSTEPNRIRTKPRLTRQSAIQDESDLPGSPGRLTVRFLTTIPSAAETSMQMEDEQPSILVSPAKEREGPLYAILHSQPTTPVRRQSIVTLHPAESIRSSSSQPSEAAGPSR